MIETSLSLQNNSTDVVMLIEQTDNWLIVNALFLLTNQRTIWTIDQFFMI